MTTIDAACRRHAAVLLILPVGVVMLGASAVALLFVVLMYPFARLRNFSRGLLEILLGELGIVVGREKRGDLAGPFDVSDVSPMPEIHAVEADYEHRTH